MDFNCIDDIKKAGFVGFKTMQELFNDISIIPKEKGVYLVLNLDRTPPVFLPTGTGGHFKGRDPNVPLAFLTANWVEKTLVIYIGKAGSVTSRATLRSRLRQYFGFGQGKNIGHWGGRLIWQIDNSHRLVVCWKPLSNMDPRAIESQLIKCFFNQFGRRPFANLAD